MKLKTKSLKIYTKYFFLLLLLVMVKNNLNAQYPRNDFRSPLDIPLYLSGTFGEPRNTHFHAGLDIKTAGVEGKNVYAIGDGYVSRVKVSAWGYGNTLYITHPNGYTSVYAHLSKFDDKIADWVKQKQIEQTSFEVDLDSLDATIFPLKMGEIIAKSGNTGGSHGPHLHFEIRDSLERPINPFLFGFDIRVKDNVKPSLYNLMIYNLTGGKQFSNTKTIKLKGSAGKYNLTETIKVNKDVISFGINTTDKFNDVHNQNGVYDIKMYFDGELNYHYQMNRFSFDNARDVLTHCDYWLKRNKNQTVHKCFVEPGNKLDTYNYLINDGNIYLHDNLVHHVKIEVSDFHQNKSELTFKIQKDENSDFFKEKEINFQEVLVQGRNNHYKSNDLDIKMKADVLFENMYLKIQKETRSSLSDIFHIGDVKIPAFDWFDVKMKVKEINENLKEKYLIAFKNYKGYVKSLGGVFDEQTKTITAESRAFGDYYIAVDTIAPRIISLSISEGKIMTKYTKFQFKITDNLSGIDEYNCFVNGNWVVLALDGKNRLYTYTIDENIVKGENNILLIVKDKRNNSSIYNASFLY